MRLPLVILTIVTAAMPVQAFDLQGHRGASGLAPENTLPAFAQALSLGVDTLELDVGLTRDNVIVIAHDRRLNADIARGPDGAYVIAPGPALRALSLDEVKRYDVGVLRPGSAYAALYPQQAAMPQTRIPTFEELAALVRRSGNQTVRFNIETKLSPLAPDETADPETFTTALIRVLRETGLTSRAAIQSFDWRTLKVAQRLAPEIPTVCLTQVSGNNPTVYPGSPWTAGFDLAEHGSVPRLVKAAGCAVWSPFFRDLTDPALAEAKALGLRTVVWTVNEPLDMLALIDRGVDGIIADYPDRLRSALATRNRPLPVPTPVAP